MKSDVLTLISSNAAARSKRSTRHDISLSRSRKSRYEYTPYKPDSLDTLSEAIRDVLMDRYLDVSKVRPMFWHMVEIYADRFQSYPFDAFKALYSYLEMKDFPADEMEAIIDKLEQAYEKKHGKPYRARAEQPSAAPPGAPDTIEEEIRELRDSLAYAALVDEESN